MSHQQQKSMVCLLRVGLALILPFLLSSCQAPPQIQELRTVPPGGEVVVGAEIPIAATIAPPDVPVTFHWVLDAGAGEMQVPSPDVASGVYRAPKQAGTYLVRLHVLYQGKKVAEKALAIKVVEAPAVGQRPPDAPPPPPSTLVATPQPKAFKPFDVTAYFVPSGWMGDGEKGETHITVDIASRESPHSPPLCVKFTYKIGPAGWAAVAYQNRDKNWGQFPGRDLRGAKKLTFWARGLTGQEVVEFKAGGMRDTKPQRDSFEASLGPVALDKAWKWYEIDLTEADLSSVISGFVWAASRSGNSLTELTFFLDDIQYE